MRAWHSISLADRDYALCLRINRWSRRPLVCTLFRTISRLGDGAIWCATIFALPIFYGEAGMRASVVLAMAALAGVGVYKLIKSRFKRPRPYTRHRAIKATALALDEFSFPSGHTLHAVAFTIVLSQALPGLVPFFLPFAVLTALSRVILGLHYPSDVAAGALVGAALAGIALKFAFAGHILVAPVL